MGKKANDSLLWQHQPPNPKPSPLFQLLPPLLITTTEEETEENISTRSFDIFDIARCVVGLKFSGSMWLRRSKTRVRVHNATSPKFRCSSFKDIHSLIADDESRGIGGGGHGSNGDCVDSPTNPSICHRNRSVKHLLRSLSHPAFPYKEGFDREIRIPGAENTVVVYFTSLRVVRRTFDDGKAVRSILRSFRVPIDERDVSMDSQFMSELQRIFGQSEKSALALPRVFIGGRYIGGAEEVRRLHECGELKNYVEGLPAVEPGTCEGCGGHGFVLCQECRGSHKCYSEKSGFRSCTSCNENGLIRCPSCFSAPQ